MGVAALLGVVLGATDFVRQFGGSANEEARAVVEAADGGYVVAGYTESFGMGAGDALVIKLDSGGNLLWARTLGGGGDDVARAVVATPDGGCLVGGATRSSGAGNDAGLAGSVNAAGTLLRAAPRGGAGAGSSVSVGRNR